MKQLTEEQAIALFDGGEWKDWTLDEIAKFQLYQERLCMPFGEFHKAMEHVLGRSIWTHEFADQQRMIDEYEGIRPMPTFEEIIALIPKEKLIVIGVEL
jgi:hypothetical protein